MNQGDAERRIEQMINLIRQEAEEKAKMIKDEASQKMEKEKNKVYTYERERLLAEFAKKYENQQTIKKLEKSRKINECRLDIQTHRNDLLEDLKQELEKKLVALISNKTRYKEILQKLIVQGLLRLLETKVFIKCRKQDVSLVKDVLSDASKEYSKFMKENINKDMSVELEVTDKAYLKDSDIGGVVLYCNSYRIVYDNSLKSRLLLGFEASVPDFRNDLFPSLKH